MSRRPISRSPDLKQLRDEEYDIDICKGYVVVRQVPYVAADKSVKRGILIDKLNAADDVATAPTNHVVFFVGDAPCDANGVAIPNLSAGPTQVDIGTGALTADQFSRKPMVGPETYANYYDKMTTYIAILLRFAHLVEPGVTAKVGQFVEQADESSVFRYEENASSRSDIVGVQKKLELDKVAIVGLGGTGSYVLDLVAKTPVKEIHLFDGDKFLQHNAFRSPGAPSGATLKKLAKKVDYFHELYDPMRSGIFAVASYIDESNVEQLKPMNFVFLCMDAGEPKLLIVKKLEEFGVPFIDVGMGLHIEDGALYGQLRTTTSTPDKRAHVWDNKRISFAPTGMNNEYATNIQVADLNALNAALAVLRWKKFCGFYRDIEKEHNATFEVAGNYIINEDRA